MPSAFARSQSRRRSSHEERGLKSVARRDVCRRPGRSSHEERGLKYRHRLGQFPLIAGRSSHEERGLKLLQLDCTARRARVAPRMRSVD